MSFKGFKKGVLRAPQTMRQKFNMGEITQDAVYLDAERRFKEIETETKKLSEESKKYFNAVNGMLDEQIDFAKAVAEIYKPISGRLSDPSATVPEDNPQGIEASELYQAVVKDLKDTLKPDLELIEKRIVEPAQELLKIIQAIRKMSVKRDHKQLDLDRHKRNLSKYELKKERTVKDEEKMFSAQAEVEIAQQEYDYYNDLLKNELPVLFQMQSDFIKPLFVSFYYMQLNIFYTLYTRMEELKIPYFDLSTDIVEAYTAKKGNIEEQTDAIGITHFKVGHAKSKLEATKRRHAAMNSPPPTGASSIASTGTGGELPAYSPGGYNQPYGDSKYQPPSSPATYQSPVVAATAQSPATYQSPVATGQPPSYLPQTPASAPPPQVGSGLPTCTALYDYTAQAQGDLTFPTGAVIEIIQRTEDANGWWTGKYNGQTGVFPGNYVQL